MFTLITTDNSDARGVESLYKSEDLWWPISSDASATLKQRWHGVVHAVFILLKGTRDIDSIV